MEEYLIYDDEARSKISVIYGMTFDTLFDESETGTFDTGMEEDQELGKLLEETIENKYLPYE